MCQTKHTAVNYSQKYFCQESSNFYILQMLFFLSALSNIKPLSTKNKMVKNILQILYTIHLENPACSFGVFSSRIFDEQYRHHA